MIRIYFARMLVSLVAVLTAPFATAATTYYIRTDGGSFSQCTGKVDAARLRDMLTRSSPRA